MTAHDAVHPIESESYRILAERVDLSEWPALSREIAARVVHATAAPELLEDLVVDDIAVTSGIDALRGGATVICDVEMVKAGVTGYEVECHLNHNQQTSEEIARFSTRTAAAMSTAATNAPEGAVLVVGCAPTALFAINDAIRHAKLRPSLVVGVPVGFVGAAESKEDLLEVSNDSGVPVITLRGERGGAAVASAILNALVRLAHDGRDRLAVGSRPLMRVDADNDSHDPATLFVIGHGTRSDDGAEELRSFIDALAKRRPRIRVESGFIEFVEPALSTSITALARSGVTSVVAVPLVLLGAGHMKDDGPAALSAARAVSCGVNFSYARDLGVHPAILSVAHDRISEASRKLSSPTDAVVVVGRGSSDPDANSDLAKVARLLADGRHLTTPAASLFSDPATSTSPAPDSHPPTTTPDLATVIPAFVSLALPSVHDALDQCFKLGARRIVVAPYFLFTGLLVDRIHDQCSKWHATHPGTEVVVADRFGQDERLLDLVWERYDEALEGSPHMNCDACIYRAPLPGYEHRVGAAAFSDTSSP